MVQKEKVYGSVRRFGARYGRKVRFKLSQIEAVYKGEHTCPYCHYKKVHRLSVGVWHCAKCDTTFTGKAYSPVHEKIVTEKTQAPPVEETVEEMPEKEDEEETDEERDMQ